MLGCVFIFLSQNSAAFSLGGLLICIIHSWISEPFKDAVLVGHTHGNWFVYVPPHHGVWENVSASSDLSVRDWRVSHRPAWTLWEGLRRQTRRCKVHSANMQAGMEGAAFWMCHSSANLLRRTGLLVWNPIALSHAYSPNLLSSERAYDMMLLCWFD